MSDTEESPPYSTAAPATDAPITQAEERAAKDGNLRNESELPHDAAAGYPPDSVVGTIVDTDADTAGQAGSGALEAYDVAPTPLAATANSNPSEGATAEPTPELPPRPAPEDHIMVTTTAVQETAGADAIAPEGDVHPQVEALRAMFPDFDAAVLQSVLESVDYDQERALDVLLGMSDPEYVSAHAVAVQPVAPSIDLDEQLARQLMLEDQQQQQQQQQRRHATGRSWPRRSDDPSNVEVPYQTRQTRTTGSSGSPPPEGAGGQSDNFQEFQRTVGQIAESGKRTFSSIVSKVKAKINEYEQSRNTASAGQPSNATTQPQWGSAPPTHLDRHTASEAYQQRYFGSDDPAGTAAAPVPPPSSLRDTSQVQPARGYDLEGPAVRDQPAPQTTPLVSLTTPPASPPTASGASSDVPRPPNTNSGSPVNAAKIGLLPKRAVSLLNTNSPPATRPSDDDDDELEYVENPFEEQK